jgi:C-terminal processing protease CtpA/Prc
LGQITSDFYTSPFFYSIALPIEPQGSYRDVSFGQADETGVQIFAVAYWNNTFGDPYLEERDLYGGGWSTAYASTRISEDPETDREIVGGIFLVYAPDEAQAFPSGFGEDGLLFTEDDPLVGLPQGYTLVDMDTEPFTFDRSRNPVVDLIEPEGAALVDLSGESYADAFNELVDILSMEYAFTEYKGIDWEDLRERYLPGMEEADDRGDVNLYRRTLRDFVWEIPDGHLFGSGPIIFEDFFAATVGGLGIAIRDVDDGRVIVNFVGEGSPAADAGITLGTEIVAIGGVPIDEHVEASVAWAAPFSTAHVERLQKLRYATRFPQNSEVEVTFVDEDGVEVTVPLGVTTERESFNFSSFTQGVTGFELPVEYAVHSSGYVVARITSFSDNSLLTIQLWERLMRNLNENQVPGLIIDMRNNGGGRGFLADQMAAYFFDEPHVLGNAAFYDKNRGEFYIDPRGEDRFYLPSDDLRYRGDVVVLVGPSCASACEFFSYDMTIENRAVTIGHYPTAGLGGSIRQLVMPAQENFRYTVGRAVDQDGEIHIEGIGVGPDIRVPVTVESLLSGRDAVLDAAVEYLSGAGISIVDGGDIAVGESISGILAEGERVRYTLSVQRGDIITIDMESDDFDAFLALYSVADEFLTFNDDISPTNLNARINELEIPADMVLLVEASSASDRESGAYILSVVAGE